MRVTLEIPDSKYSVFLDLIKDLEYVTIDPTEEIPEWQQTETLRRSEAIRTGLSKARSWDEAKQDIFRKR